MFKCFKIEKYYLLNYTVTLHDTLCKYFVIYKFCCNLQNVTFVKKPNYKYSVNKCENPGSLFLAWKH